MSGPALRALRHGIHGLLAVRRGETGRFAHLREAESFAALSEEAMLDEQLRRLRKVLVAAVDEVPYWREEFRRLGFDPRALRSVADLGALPILDKARIRERSADLVSRRVKGWRPGLLGRLRGRRILRCTTGGTTGEPLNFLKTEDDMERQMALHLRHFRRLGVRAGESTATVWGYHRPPAGRFLTVLTGRSFFNAFAMADSELEGWARRLHRQRPRLIYGYTSALDHLARFFFQQGIPPVPGLELVITTTEKLYPQQRQTIEGSLGGRVFDEYGSHEVPLIASECRSGSMHLASDAAVVEFVPGDEEEADLAPRVILTSLVSSAQPFVRYDIGDRARPQPGRCECGSAFPRIAMDIGKEHLILRFRGGRSVNSVYFFKHVYRVEGIGKFQLRQTSPECVEIVVVPASGARAAVERALQQEFDRFGRELGSDLEFAVRFVEDIPQTRRGKHPLVVIEGERALGSEPDSPGSSVQKQ